MNTTISSTRLNRWQRLEMRAAALRFVRDRIPSDLDAALTHRELSFATRPLWTRWGKIQSNRTRAKHGVIVPSGAGFAVASPTVPWSFVISGTYPTVGAARSALARHLWLPRRRVW